jgi:hypothetical protein
MTGVASGREAPVPPPDPGPDRPLVADVAVLFAVAAAHRVGQPLNPELVALGGRFVRSATTAPVYRMIALPAGGAGVARGGIVRVPAGGAAIEVELHQLPRSGVDGLAGALPAPLAIGTVELAGGPDEIGIVCTFAPNGALDISAHGSWPAYLAEARRARSAGAPPMTV